MRSSMILLAALVATGCGLLNGATEGELRSPVADLLGGGGGEGEGEGLGTNCSDDEECLQFQLLCDYVDNADSGTCADPSVWAWCDEAGALGERENDGPILWNTSLTASALPNCADLIFDYHDPDGDFPTTEDDVLAALNVRSNALGADTVATVQLQSADEFNGTIIAGVCGASTPSIVAVSAQDFSDHRSNAACAATD